MISSKLFSKFSLSNTPYYFSFFFIGTCFIFSIFSYLIIPDKTRNANTMNLNIQSVKPGFKVQTLYLPSKKNKKLSEYVFGTDYSIEQYAIRIIVFHLIQYILPYTVNTRIIMMNYLLV